MDKEIPQGMRNRYYISKRKRLPTRKFKVKKATRGTGKGKSFLKKGSGILCEGNRLKIYLFIQQNHDEFGIRWLLRKFKLSPNAYYNFLKNKKANYNTQKQKIKKEILKYYHRYNGTPGYRMINTLLERKRIIVSKLTVYKYMKELGIRSIVMKKRPSYLRRKAHKVFPKLINRKFYSAKPNKIWATDFTYLNLSNGAKRYNCTIIDLYDRSVVATLNGKEITSDLAIKTLKLALSGNKNSFKDLVLHSDQGCQFTSKEFIEFCQSKEITQSMSKAGCPYDNAPMERYFNSFKNEFYYLFKFNNDDSLNDGVIDYAYSWYNHIRPHTHNNGLTPFEARKRAYAKNPTEVLQKCLTITHIHIP
jgi:putative transposase